MRFSPSVALAVGLLIGGVIGGRDAIGEVVSTYVRRSGDSMSGTLHLRGVASPALDIVSVPSGSDALALRDGQRLNFSTSDSAAKLYRSAADTIATDGTFSCANLSSSGPLTVSLNDIRAVIDAGLTLQNSTVTDAGNTSQYSPAIVYKGAGFGSDGGAGASSVVACRDYLVPVSAAGAPTGYMIRECQIGSGGWVEVERVTNAGIITLPSTGSLVTTGYIDIGALSYFSHGVDIRHTSGADLTNGAVDPLLVSDPQGMMVRQAAIASTATVAIDLSNTTASTSGANTQYSPYLVYSGTGFGSDGGAGASSVVACREYVVPVSAAGAPTGYVVKECQIGSNGWVEIERVTSAGALTVPTINGTTINGTTITASSDLNVSKQAVFAVQDTPACGTTLAEGTIRRDTLSGQAGVRTRLCMCTSNGNDAGVTYAWQNLATGGLGNTTSCDTL